MVYGINMMFVNNRNCIFAKGMMKLKRIVIVGLVLIVTLSGLLCAFAQNVPYLPDVRKEMSNPNFWTSGDELLMTYDEIELQNKLTVSAKETCMYDLKNQNETVNTLALNEALIDSTKADIKYYLGWTYLESNQKAVEADFDEILKNTQNHAPKEKDSVIYAVAVKRTNLHTFPSHKAIWDDPADPECNYQYLESVRVNEPVVITSVSNDGKFYLAKNICCSGWIPAEDVALCKDKNEWLSAWDFSREKRLVVYGDKVYTQMSVTGKATSELLLTMGTVLELADVTNPNELTDNRAAYQNYAVYIPIRNSDGSYNKKLTLIPESEKVHTGYLPMTEKNIVSVALEALGNTYGWGNWLNSDDCSGYVKNVYKCFGLELARNTSWQSAMPMAKINMEYMCREERVNVLDAMPVGTVLYFSGHEMMYLGKDNGKYFVVSAVGSIMQPQNPAVRQRIRSTVINSLEVKRSNGNMWIDDLNLALVPFRSADNDKMPGYAWYHDGVAYCLKNKIMKGDDNKYFNPENNITWAETLQIMYNINGETAKESDALENENWYDEAISWSKNSGLVMEENIGFNPDAAITREELASVIYLYAKFKGADITYSSNIKSFDDAGEVSEYAISAMNYCFDKGIINGKSETTINPKDNARRAEIALIIQRLCSVIAQ